MKDTRKPRSGRARNPRISTDAERLVAGAVCLAQSGSRLEEGFWQRQLTERLERLLEAGHSSIVRDALEQLDQAQPDAFAALFELVESLVESMVLEVDGALFDVLLLAAPVVAWTRFRIPSGPIPAKSAQALAETWQSVLLAPEARFRMVPYLYSVDQFPSDFSELRRLMRKLGTAAIAGAPPGSRQDPNLKGLPPSVEMLADSRLLLAVAAVPHGEPMFRWQLGLFPTRATRSDCELVWANQAEPILESLLPGCGIECVLPDACHVSLREVDRRIRPYAIKAAVHFLMNTLHVAVDEIKATIAPFGEQQVDEYRIGFSVGKSSDVVQGVVWPLLGPEAETDVPDPLERIREALQEAGVTDVKVWSKLTEPDYCEDCGVPLYPNPAGDVVHAEMPEDADPEAEHFH